MRRKRDRRWKILAFFFLTALIAIFLWKFIYIGQTGRGELVLENQVKYYNRVTKEGKELSGNTDPSKLSSKISSFLGKDYSLPEGPFSYGQGKFFRIKKIRVSFVPFTFEGKFFVLGFFTPDKRRRRKNYFLEESSILTGEREGVSFVLFEHSSGFKISIMSEVPIENILQVARNIFMDGEK